MPSPIGAPLHVLAVAVLGAAGAYMATVLLARIGGLRSFSKMSTVDFAMTVAVGSVIAATAATPSVPLASGATALGALFAIQFVMNLGRRWEWVRRAVENTPVLLMRDGEMLVEAMHRARVTEGDLRSKLREANVFQLDEVAAVVMETTGDISVLHRSDQRRLDPWLLDGVAGLHRSPG